MHRNEVVPRRSKRNERHIQFLFQKSVQPGEILRVAWRNEKVPIHRKPRHARQAHRLASDQKVSNASGIEFKKQIIHSPAQIGPTAGRPTVSKRSFPRATKISGCGNAAVSSAHPLERPGHSRPRAGTWPCNCRWFSCAQLAHKEYLLSSSKAIVPQTDEIYVEKHNGSLLLTDDGYTIVELASSGMTFSTEKRKGPSRPF